MCPLFFLPLHAPTMRRKGQCVAAGPKHGASPPPSSSGTASRLSQRRFCQAVTVQWLREEGEEGRERLLNSSCQAARASRAAGGVKELPRHQVGTAFPAEGGNGQLMEECDDHVASERSSGATDRTADTPDMEHQEDTSVGLQWGEAPTGLESLWGKCYEDFARLVVVLLALVACGSASMLLLWHTHAYSMWHTWPQSCPNRPGPR